MGMNSTRIPVSARIRNELYRRYQDYAVKNGVVKNVLIERAIEYYLDFLEKPARLMKPKV